MSANSLITDCQFIRKARNRAFSTGFYGLINTPEAKMQRLTNVFFHAKKA